MERSRRPSLHWLFGILILLASPLPADASDREDHLMLRGKIADDVYAAGPNVRVDAQAAGDVVAAGGRVLIEDSVGGDALAAGGQVEIRARVMDDVRAAGGQVRLAGTVGSDALAAGGHVWLLEDASVTGRAWFAAGSVEIDGRVGRELRAAGREVIIRGEIDGDVLVHADSLKILPGARIGGSLEYRSPKQAEIAPDATIAGPVTHHPVERHMPGKAAARVACGLVLVMLLVMAIVYRLLFPRFAPAAARLIRERPWASLGLGAALLFATPPVAVLLLMTVLGAFLGLSLLALYPLFLLAGFLTGMLFAGDALLRLTGNRAASRGWQTLALAAAFVLLWLLTLVPLIGCLVVLLVLLFGLGAVGMGVFRARVA